MNKIDRKFDVFEAGTGVPVHAWTRGIPFDHEARNQVLNAARMPFVHKWASRMPDVHAGKGAVRVRKDELGIIAGSMGARCYIVKGLG